MLTYYLELALRSLRRNVALTVLMILAIAFGVGASMTTLTVLHVLASDPIPGKSHQLYYVQVDPREFAGLVPNEEPESQLTRSDAEALLRDKRGDRQAMMTGGSVSVEPQRADLAPFFIDGRWTSTDFFPMFEVPFLAGRPWTTEDDAQKARVVVIAKPLADKLFGSLDVIGKSVRAAGTDLRIVGVIDDWRPAPHFYDLFTGSYSSDEQLFVPFSTTRELKFDHNGNMNCWGNRDREPDQYALDVPCTWIQYWVELETPAKASAYRDYLVQYSQDQRKAGRFQRPPNVRLRDVISHLEFHEVVPKDAK